jgi:hypothetical protein
MGIVSWNDVPVILAIVAGVLLPELLGGFKCWQTIVRLAMLTVCCLVATVLAHALQRADPGAAFTRAFLTGITARILLTLNHVMEAILQQRKEPKS